jgi:poly(3-hydroxybutyrate) depolymerase
MRRRWVFAAVALSLIASGGAQFSRAAAAAATSFDVNVSEFVGANGSRSLPTTVYLPAAASRPWPLLVFAHGFNSDPSQYDVLLRSWAAAGYVVAAPASPGIDPQFGPVSTSSLPEQAGDISATITAVLTGAAGVNVDADRIAVAGHSDGGSTAARMALGQQARDDRVQAYMVLSGATDIPDTYGATNTVPLFAAVGTDDEYGDYPATRAVYDTAAPPKVFVSIDGGRHLDPYLEDSTRGNALRAATVDFLDASLHIRGLAWDALRSDANSDGLSLEWEGAPIPMPSDPMLVYATSTLGSGSADAVLPFGVRGDQIIVGDWNGDGVATLGVWRDSTATFYLSDDNVHTDAVIPFGEFGDTPIVGDWTGSGRDTIGVYRQGQWFLRAANVPGPADASFVFGNPGDTPIVGDWNGDHKTTVGVHRDDHWYLRNTTTTGIADVSFVYGNPGDTPLVGDWNGDGRFTVGVQRGNVWLLRDTNAAGGADRTFVYGDAGDAPLAARFGRSARTTVAVVR